MLVKLLHVLRLGEQVRVLIFRPHVRGVLEVVYCGTRASSRVRARAPPVQHPLRGGYKRGLHAFQGGQKNHGRFSIPEEEKRGGGARGSNCLSVSPRDVALGHALR